MFSRTTLKNFKLGAPKSLLVSLLVLFSLSSASAQFKGLIVQPATSAGQAVLDPNKDGYVSAGKTGFGSNDIAESEISYKALPQLSQDPSSDLGPGPDCSFTDLVDAGTTEQAISMYVDANNNLMFRFRLGSSSPNSKGYSILIDTDNKFGNTGANADPNYTSVNPGFEIEVVLRTNFGVDLNDIDGRSLPLTKITLNYNDHAQKSIAHTTNCGDYDYFYDFYIPVATITSYFPGFSTSTAVRMVGTTVIAPKSALEGPISDLGGVDDRLFADNSLAAWTALVNNFVPTSLSGIKSGSTFSADRSDAPVITSPITSTANTISGTSTEAVGTSIIIYKNGTQIGTATVQTGGIWSLTGITVASGDAITATAQASGESVSLTSSAITVGGSVCSAAPTLNCASDKGIIINGPTGSAAGTIINVYRVTTSGPVLISSGPTVAGTYTYKCNNAFQNCNSGQRCVVDGTYYFTATEAGKCESVPSAFVDNGCTGSTTAPVISTSSSTALSGTTNVAGQSIIIRINNVIYGTTVASTSLTNGSYGWSYSGFSATAGQIVSVRGISTGGCATVAASATITEVAAAPVITTTSISTATTSISGTSTEANGSIITIYKNGVAVGTATVNYGKWTLNAPVGGFGFTSGDEITAKVTTATNKTISDASNTVTVSTATTRIPAITTPVGESATSISGTSASPVGTVIKVYLDEDYIGQATVVFGATGNTWSLTSIDPNYKLYPGGVLTATATETGLAESAPSTKVIIQCDLPVATKTVTATNTCQTFTADVTISNPEASVIYRLKSGSTYYSAYAVALAGATSLTITTDALPNVTTLTLTVEAQKIAPSTCSTNLTNTVTVNVYGLPDNNLTVTPSAATICSGGTVNISIANSATGVNYQLRNGTTNVGSAVAGNNGSITLSTTLTATTTLNILATNGTTGCNRVLTTTPVITVNAQEKTVTAVNTTVCAGGTTTIQVLNSELNATYQLRIGTTNVGAAVTSNSSGSTISLPTNAINTNTTFNVVATKAGCTTVMASQPTVTIGNPMNLPVSASATTICSGGSVNLTIANSEAGVNYQLVLNGSNVGSAVPGTGSSTTPLALATVSPTAATASATYNYTVVATRTGGTCSATTLTVPTITVNVQPTTRTVTFPTGIFCSGSTANISIASSQSGVSYQLRTGTTNVGSPVSGNGNTITLSTGTLNATATYNILAYNANSSCTIVLPTTGTIQVNGQKAVSAVTSTLCAGSSTDIIVQNTEVGVNYTLTGNGSTSVTIPGDGGTIGLPTGNLTGTTTFTVTAVSGTGGSACTITMTNKPTVTVTNPSATLTVNAPNAVCSGSSANITVGGTETGVSYQLKVVGGANVGTPVNGNTGNITLPTGPVTGITQFEVVATRSIGGCVTTLNTKPTINVNMQPATKTATATSSTICNNSSTSVTVSNVEAGVNYILRVGTTIVDTKTGTAGSNITLNTGNLTTNTTFNVIAATSTCTTTIAASVPVTVVTQQKNVFAEQSSVCLGSSTNILVDLSGASVTYRLYNSANTLLSTVAGNGGTISLPTGAINATTTYTVTATTTSPVCSTVMSITPIVTVTTPPSNNTVTAPEGVCSGTAGTISVANTLTGVTYYLRKGAVIVSSQAGSNGASVNLSTGNMVSGTTFNILAVHNASGCSTQLATTPFIEIDCEAVYSPSNATYAAGYSFAPHEIISRVTDADGFNTSSNLTAVITSGALPNGISLNPFTGEIFVSNVWNVAASSATVGIRTTDVNGKTTNHIFVISIATPGTPLPVEFLSFSAKLNNGKVDINWATVWETNNDFFTIERSADGIKFQAIGTMEGAGNSTALINYEAVDVNPLSGISYYRIKQTDFNGDFDYSKVAVVRNYRNEENKISINAYPNPVLNGNVNITIPGSKGETVYMQVIDVTGKILIENNLVMEDNATNMNLISGDGQRLKPGMYTLVTYLNNNRYTVKLIIN